jgi:uncharacterized protein (TIGR00255 family)
MKSMTGFGRAEGPIGPATISIEVKSVNHRYLDARFRLPSSLSQFEMGLSEVLRSQFERGSFEIYVKSRMTAVGETIPGTTRIVVDELAMKSMMESCQLLHAKYKTEKIPSLETLALTGRVFVPQEETFDFSSEQEDLKKLFKKALSELDKMRQAEGKRLETILRDGLQALKGHAEELTKIAPTQPERILEKLKNRIAQWPQQNLDAQRLEWEVAFYADRSDVSEEIDRLKAHIAEFERLLGTSKSVGRKLDFLTQELHREVNTLGSKANLIEMTRLGLDAKTAIEKLREQVQNVE